MKTHKPVQNGGIPVCTEGGVQRLPQLVPTDEAGAIVYWLDYREDFGDSTEDAIYAQRLDADGKPLWEMNGIPVCSAPKAQITPRAIATGANGRNHRLGVMPAVQTKTSTSNEFLIFPRAR